jgi:glycosyltransferase involved in cell wall biosynthesis
MDLEKITLIVPTKNEARNIGFFLDSVPPGIKIIVVDASSDNTLDVIFGKRRQSLRIISDDGNIATARQIAAERAQTDWLLYSDADVAFAEDYFNKLSALNPGVYHGAVVGAKLSRNRYRYYYYLFSQLLDLCAALGLPAGSGSNMLVRRRALLEVGGFDRSLSCNEDTELIWRIHRHGFRIDYESSLRVFELDHRRLDRGVLRKTVHSLTRNTLIFCGFSSILRKSDWGYWDSPSSLPLKLIFSTWRLFLNLLRP